MNNFKNLFPKLTKVQCMEFGLVAVLVNIILSLYLNTHGFVVASLILTLITIIAPVLFYPFAIIWFGLSQVLSAVSTRLMMILVFSLLVVPVGLFRKFLGKDNLKINQFKKEKHSVMINRNHLYTDSDLLNTF